MVSSMFFFFFLIPARDAPLTLQFGLLLADDDPGDDYIEAQCRAFAQCRVLPPARCPATVPIDLGVATQHPRLGEQRDRTQDNTIQI